MQVQQENSAIGPITRPIRSTIGHGSSDFGDPTEVGNSSDHLRVERMDFAGSRFVRCRIEVVGEATSNQILRHSSTKIASILRANNCT